ncbi:10 TM acyl transferase domain found in Cas1p-domain-containing protein [Dichotomocladium elegans]|nr:10 TM acyl transferase domain found in Cas1p-domain-containing protein [Dichotomocladium elegans]
MLNDGWWLGDHYDRWQPSGCMAHDYNAQQISSCLNHSRVLYVGDSIMREQFTSMGSFLPGAEEVGESMHDDRQFLSSKYGMTVELWWDPYINETRTAKMLSNTDPDNRPSLLVIGSGPWYMKNLHPDEYFDAWKARIDAVFDAVESPAATVADAVLLSPVEVPQFNLLNKERGDTITLDKIERMNDYLQSRVETLNPQVPFAVPFAWNAIGASTINMTLDGLHFLPGVTKVQAQLALNFRCNEGLPKHFPFDTTCCNSYPAETWYQIAILLFFMIWLPIGFFVLSADMPFLRRFYPSSLSIVTSLFVFGLGVTYMYLGDRTHLFSKEFKFFDRFTFGWLMLATVVAGVVSLRKYDKVDSDQGFLNRAQTDEWKGWMQIIILVYHFTGASGTPGIYNAMRVLVAAYLFQTGYGHFFFFYKKADFGFERVMNVMVRLNLLTLVLEYLMDTNYLSYYFTPLVTFWFGVIWLTMFVGHSHNKSHVWFILLKIAVAGAVTGVFIHVPGVLETTFDILRVLINVHWDPIEWRFRLALDAWIVYVGMIFALGTIKFSEHKWHEKQTWYGPVKKAAVVGSVIGLGWYFYFELSMPTKAAYTAWHPYMSWIPIVAFIILRNATLGLRNTTSGFYEFIGKCSLETFIGQFHMWLAADTKGLLVLLPNPAWAQGLGWWCNLALSSALFVFVCYYLSKTTGEITKWIITSAQQQQQDQQMKDEHRVPLLPITNNSASSTTVEEEWDQVEQRQQQEKPSWWRKAASDLRVKATIFLLTLAVLNHFC